MLVSTALPLLRICFIVLLYFISIFQLPNDRVPTNGDARVQTLTTPIVSTPPQHPALGRGMLVCVCIVVVACSITHGGKFLVSQKRTHTCGGLQEL